MNPFEHQVRERAYFIWEGEGRVFGRAEDHWLRAERELHETAGPMLVHAVAAELTLAPSPVEALDKTLKTKASRTRSATAKAAEKAATKTPVPHAAKAATVKTPTKAASAKPAAAKGVTANHAKAPRAAESSANIH